MAKTPKEFEAYLPSLFLDIALDGIILYDSDRYVTNRLDRLQRLIQMEGLQREQMGDDFISPCLLCPVQRRVIIPLHRDKGFD